MLPADLPRVVPAGALPIVAVTGVEKTYTVGKTAYRALKKVDFELRAGEFVALCGPSGSGKSTLLNVIGGIDRPSAGEVHFLGQDLVRLRDDELARWRAEQIGFIFQFFNLLPVMSVFDNVFYPLMLLGKSRDAASRAVADMLDRVGLSNHVRKRPAELSGGQQQRVAIARALVKRPALVIADEPTGNLDSDTGAEILALMKDINRDAGSTFLISTHAEAVKAEAHRVITIRDGVLSHETR